MRHAVLALFLSCVAPLSAQTPSQNTFRARLEQLPIMAIDSVALPLPLYPVLGRVSAVTADDRGNLYILNRAADGDPVVVLDPDGRLLRSWGKGLFTMPHGIRIDPAGNVWTVDANTSKIYKFNAAGGLLLQMQLERPREDIEFCGATDVAFLPDGHVLVSDGYCNGRVVELNPDGERVREWGSRGREPGQFRVAHSIALGPDQVVYVADRENGRLQRFDRLGRLLGVWDYVSQLYSVAFSREGELYISLRLTEEPRNYIVRIDPATGEMLERTSLNCLGHELAVSPGGALLPGLLCPDSTGHVLLYRRRD